MTSTTRPGYRYSRTSSSASESRLQGLHYECGALPARWRTNPRFWSLPHDVRRLLFAAAAPRAARRALHKRQVKLRPFVASRSLFIHIPKAAGVSITSSLYGSKTGDHRSIADYALLFSKSDFEAFSKFTVVRHPLDRLRSAYRFLAAGGRNATDARTFEQYISCYRDFRSFACDLPGRSDIQALLHFRPQVSFLRLPGRSRLVIDFFVRLEEIKTEFPRLQAVAATNSSLSFLNRTELRDDHDVEDLDDEALRAISNVYRDDFQFLGYDVRSRVGA